MSYYIVSKNANKSKAQIIIFQLQIATHAKNSAISILSLSISK